VKGLAKVGIRAERHPRQQVADNRERALRRSAPARSAPWSPPTSPPAASTSTASAMCSISTCRTCRKPMSTVSAAPRAPAPKVSRSSLIAGAEEMGYLRDIEKLIRVALPPKTAARPAPATAPPHPLRTGRTVPRRAALQCSCHGPWSQSWRPGRMKRHRLKRPSPSPRGGGIMPRRSRPA